MITRRMILAIITVLSVTPLFAAIPARPCALSRDLIGVYDSAATAKPADFGRLRLAVETFMSNCPNGPADHASRKVFFDLLDREFTTEFAPQMAKAGSADEAEARWEAITIFQSDLSHFLETIVVPSDIEFKDTILKVGSGRAIASLGAPAKSEVLRLATTAGHKLSGFEHHHNAQESALGALGYWIDPENREFSASDKSRFTNLLMGALDASDGIVHGGPHQALFTAIVNSLGHSDDPKASEALRRFAAKLPAKKGEIYDSARKSAEAVDVRVRRKHA